MTQEHIVRILLELCVPSHCFSTGFHHARLDGLKGHEL